MKFTKQLAVALAVAAAVFPLNCESSGKQEGFVLTANFDAQQGEPLNEETVKSLMKRMESSNIAAKQAACPWEQLPGHAMYKTSLLDKQTAAQNKCFNRMQKFDQLSVSEIQQTGDYASARLSYMTEKKKLVTELMHYVRINGEWRLDPIGVKTVKPLKVTGYDGALLEVAGNLCYTYENEPFIVLDMRSKTTTSYSLGWANAASFTLVTNAGEFPPQDTELFAAPTNSAKVTSAKPSRLLIPFKGAAGEPQALCIVGFCELSDRGLPTDRDSAQVMTLTFSECTAATRKDERS